jgi:hypothetical protein
MGELTDPAKFQLCEVRLAGIIEAVSKGGVFLTWNGHTRSKLDARSWDSEGWSPYVAR